MGISSCSAEHTHLMARRIVKSPEASLASMPRGATWNNRPSWHPNWPLI